MSSNENREEGIEAEEAAARSEIKPQAESSASASTETAEKEDSMKRAAARQLIEKYYYQLTDGCGNPECANENCASSSRFVLRNITCDQAAAQALQLFKQKAQLCESNPPPKVAKVPENNQANDKFKEKEADKPSTSTSTAGSLSDITSNHKVEKDVPFINEEKLLGIIKDCQDADNWSLLIKTIGLVFSSPESLAKSFLKEDVKQKAKEEEDKVVEKSCDEGGGCGDSENGEEKTEETPMEDNSKEAKSASLPHDPDKDVMSDEETPVSNTDQWETISESSEPGNASDVDEMGIQQIELSGETPSDTPMEVSQSNSSRVFPARDSKPDELTVDIESLKRTYKTWFAIPNQPFQSALINALISLARNIEYDLRYHNMYDKDRNYINIFVIVMEIPDLHSPEYLEQAYGSFCKALGVLPVKAQAHLTRIWSTYPKDRQQEMVQSLHQMITVKVITGQWTQNHNIHDDDVITGATKVMKLLYYASVLGGQMDPPDVIAAEKLMNESIGESLQDLLQGAVAHEPKEQKEQWEDPLAKELCVSVVDCRKPVIPFEDFVNDPLNDQIEMDKDVMYYRIVNNKFSFMTYSFILATATKNLGMYYDNRIRMINERRTSWLQSIVHGAPSMPYLRLRIRRDHIIDDALVGLEMAAMDNPADLKKQLYVEFDGEQGIDEGGVQKEFFQLVVDEIFNPDFGMFTYNEDTRCFWFNPTSFENDGQFTLIGIVLGLAIYNNVILDVHFPMVVYRKLMSKKGTFVDLKDSHPVLGSSLQELLDFDGDLEETFMQTFSISYQDVFGTTITHHLKKDGDKMPVTNENRKEFVDMYADFLLNKSVEKQFKAFKRGFCMVTDESPLKMLFRPEEVELLVCGSKNFDFRELELAADYDGGYTSSSPTIKYFWEVVHNFSEDQKRLLLQFTTGSDRVPVGGLSKLKLIIARNGPDTDRLPTSHTCFNVLLLPEYTSKEKLEERLLKAVTHAKGFGML